MSSCGIRNDTEAAKVENEFVHNVYDDISNHFSLTRHSPWPNVLKFVESFPKGSILIDVGCGNGKYFGFNRNIYEIGGDTSMKLCNISKNKGFEILLFNCLTLPFCENSADGIICIAVLHHLATDSRRIKAVQEILRILKPDGRALIYTWAMDQKNSKYVKKFKENIERTNHGLSMNDTSNYKVNDSVTLPVHLNGTKFEYSDLLVPWKLNYGTKATYLRYYHVFRERELENLCSLAGGTVLSSYFEEGNWCVLLKK